VKKVLELEAGKLSDQDMKVVWLAYLEPPKHKKHVQALTL